MIIIASVLIALVKEKKEITKTQGKIKSCEITWSTNLLLCDKALAEPSMCIGISQSITTLNTKFSHQHGFEKKKNVLTYFLPYDWCIYNVCSFFWYLLGEKPYLISFTWLTSVVVRYFQNVFNVNILFSSQASFFQIIVFCTSIQLYIQSAPSELATLVMLVNTLQKAMWREYPLVLVQSGESLRLHTTCQTFQNRFHQPLPSMEVLHKLTSPVPCLVLSGRGGGLGDGDWGPR